MNDRPAYRHGWVSACEQMAYEAGVSVGDFAEWGRRRVEELGYAPGKAETIAELKVRMRDE